MTEQDFYEKISNATKFGCSYIRKNLMLVPVKNPNGWKIVNAKTWKTLYCSADKKSLYGFVTKALEK